MNYKIISRILGLLILVLGGSMSVALAWGLFYRESDASALLLSMGMCALAGMLLLMLGREAPTRDVNRREGLAIVALGWLVGAAFAGLPFALSTHSPGFDQPGIVRFADAYFESMSGLTTTGASILSDIESNSRCILFWRSFTHWLGGMGIVVLFVAIMPFLGVGGRQLFKSEVPGPTPEGIQPKILHTARTLWLIYIGISVAETVALMACKLDLFDALCHTFGTMATGGYSTKNASVGHFESASVDLVITFFMFAAGVNFGLYFLALTGSWRKALRDPELRAYSALIVICTAAVTIGLMGARLYEDAHVALRHSLFQVVSIQTTTGFGTANFDVWPPFVKTLFIILMFVGGCAGSTGGGMKVIRVMVLVRFAMQSVYKVFHPEAVLSVKIGRAAVSRQVVQQIVGFFVCAVALFAIGTLTVAAFGYDIVTSASSTAATLWNIGPGLARVGSVENYSFMHPFVKFFLSILMAMGRLELFTILVLFSPSFWKK